jgi:hypothetical protein
MSHTLQIKATAGTSYIQEAVPCRHTTYTTALPSPLISMNQHTPTISLFRTTPPYSHPLSIKGKTPFSSPNTKSLMQIDSPKPSILSSKLQTIFSTKQREELESRLRSRTLSSNESGRNASFLLLTTQGSVILLARLALTRISFNTTNRAGCASWCLRRRCHWHTGHEADVSATSGNRWQTARNQGRIADDGPCLDTWSVGGLSCD